MSFTEGGEKGFESRRWMVTWPVRYGFAVALVATSTALRFALQLLGPFQSAYILFYPAVVVIAMWAGLWPGIVGTLLATVSGSYFFLEPRNSFAVRTPENLIGPTLFSIIGVSLTLLTCSRAEATDALKESEANFKRAQAVAQIGSWRIDIAKNEVTFSDETYRIMGLRPGEPLTVEQTINILHPDDRERVLRDWTAALQTGSYEGEDRVLVQGKTRWFRVQAKVERDQEGRAQAALGTIQDITERKQAEQERQKAEVALRSREAHFRILVEQALDGIFIADVQGNYLDANSAGAGMLGFTREEILQRSIADVVAVEEHPRIAEELTRFLGDGTIRSEWKFRRADGSFFPGEVVGRRLPDGRLQGILRDMTELKRAEEILRQSEERFRVALKDSPITVFSQDRDLRYTWIFNPHSYWQEEIGKSDEEIIGAERARSLVDLKRRVLETGAGMREEVVIPHNGTKHSFDVTIEPLFDSERNVIGITGASMDIARLRELADRLYATKEKLAQEKLYLESEIETELGFEEIIGQSSSLREVLQKARVVAPTDSTVLLLGETGTGKELVARSVHTLSPRHDQSFIKLNCAAVPSGLLESELFGHEKGAFTGAVNQKVGRLELADKGTLFLDEVGELPLELQPKLLRVLQDREFERLGGVKTLQVDVRIISATNRDLQKDVAEKRFREDLFYRLNVFPLQLPPLRDRRPDIPVLVHHFVRKHAGRMGRQIELIPNETMRVLQHWNWPGNIRELENMIERMVILSKGRTLAPPPAELHEPQGLGEDNLTEMEREHIIRVLRQTHGVLSGPEGAANRLGIKRTTLQSMLKRFEIEVEDFRRGTGTFEPD
jgi:formate hydrogenlyase transcriptional activator